MLFFLITTSLKFKKILLQLKHGKYKSENIFSHGNAGRLIASHLKKLI